MDTDLFGNPVQATESPAGKKRPTTNDMDLIERVLHVACTDGYALIGPQERVYRTGAKDAHGIVELEYVTAAEANAVHQLIDTHDLTVGGQHHYRYRNHREGYGRSVLAPAKTHGKSARWAALRRPTTWGTNNTHEGK